MGRSPAITARLRSQLGSAGIREHEGLLRRLLAVEPLDAGAWTDLGQLLWDRAVAGRDDDLRRQAQRCIDLARVLEWPWDGPPPLIDYERMQWTRLGRPPVASWPANHDPDEVRRGAIAFLADPGAGADWIAGFYRHGDEFTARADGALRFWIPVAVTAALGDREERVRRMEVLAAVPVDDLLPDWLAAANLSAWRAGAGPALTRLRNTTRRIGHGCLAAVEDHFLSAVLLALRNPDIPLAVARTAIERLGWLRWSSLDRARALQTAGALAANHRDGGGAALVECVHRAAAVLPDFEHRLAQLGSLAEEESSAADAAALLDIIAARPARRRALLLRVVAEALDDLPGAVRADLGLRVLELAEGLAGPDSGARLGIALAVVRAARRLPLAQLNPLLQRACRGWNTADDHDSVLVGLVDVLLRAAAEGDPAALDQARHHSTMIDRGAARALVMLRLSWAYADVDPAEGVRLATDALRRVRAGVANDTHAWPLKIAAGRLLARAGQDDGVALLYDAARRLGTVLARRRMAWSLADCVRGLAEAATLGAPECLDAATDVTAAIRPAAARWLAELYLARGSSIRGAAAVREQLARAGFWATKVRRWPSQIAVEAPLLQHFTSGEDAPPTRYWETCLELVEPCPATAVSGRAWTRAERLAGLAAKVVDDRDVVRLAEWAVAQRRGTMAILGLGLAADGLETVLARRADEAADEARKALAEAYAERVRSARQR